ncbi:bifunctional alpha,alpha-trehalose-phosphate synthase (UDP-forming)/trehalose-phosphatase [Halobacterium zhouii]|uniref:bifunctional alpha,alpha-trehalose-phosphate synthase (UDP-forming)/trehalose-phosphatase n=1 Tax=Halobacterium zhouii TaxID=2902624 RepID=UPI001E29717A|nr:bifunctional alpha,alpha-trehalose-phosphate synthase (UDP-forming)/trehalose-phosphatase [Halobacterium zhouii]
MTDHGESNGDSDAGAEGGLNGEDDTSHTTGGEQSEADVKQPETNVREPSGASVKNADEQPNASVNGAPGASSADDSHDSTDVSYDASPASVLDGRELLVASNRKPYSFDRDDDGDVTVSKPAGGLTSALDPIVQRLSGTWVGWGSGDADFDVADERGCIEVPPEDPEYTIQCLHLNDREVEGYYYGYSNQVLWPLCHGMPSRANFDGEFWRFYQQVNETFADALVDRADAEDPVVWFQDYHLALAPRLVREQLPDAFLTQFWHIPWPSWSTFQTCPQHRELLEGLLANDLLGFHDEAYVEAFCECVEAAFEDATVDVDAGTVTYDGHTTRIECHPLGIDAEQFSEMAESEESAGFWSEFAGDHDLGERVAVGVDRLDYTKGILQRLDALERLWERQPERRGELTYVQKASESRSQIDEYRELQCEVERRVGELNDRFGTEKWTPVVYTTDHYSRTELAALYRNADVALVSPLRDGMNLVAKEYVASQVEHDGALVLSAFAGATQSLGDDALVVNPNDVEEFATTIEAALSMPERTRTRRMRALRRRVHDEDNDAWVADQLETVAAADHGDGAASASPNWQSAPVSIWGHKQRLLDTVRAADGLLVVTDFDGTAAEIVDDPESASMRGRTRLALETLASHPQVKVGVVSGRALEDVRERADIDGACWAGNHGLEFHDGDTRSVHSDGERAQEVLPDVCAAVTDEMSDIDGVHVEDKGATATVHYRMADCGRDEVVTAVHTAIDEHAGGVDLRVTEGKDVVEVRPDADWGKGEAVELLRDRFTPEGEQWVTMYVGDDTTDEAAFETLQGEGVGVAVGKDTDATAAPYAVNDPSEVADLFEWLAGTGLAALDAERRQDVVVESH